MRVYNGLQLTWKRKDGKIIKIGYFHKADKGLELIMPRKKSKHRLRMYGGSYGINKEILDELVQTIAVINMKVVVDEGKEVLISTPYNWKTKGIEFHSKGFEKQIHLQEHKFDKWYK